jgi:hypothetical protein
VSTALAASKGFNPIRKGTGHPWQASALEASVVMHAESEEAEEFEALGAHLEPARLERMKRAAEFAESVAPTHPHPGVESAVANLLVGPFASMLDRTRDAFAGKS